MQDVTVAIMAGGKSSRMGTDKAFVDFQGRPMIEAVLARVSGLGAETILIANQPAAFAHLGLPVFTDVLPDNGPLGGIYTAVYHAQTPYTLVVACDMPWLNPALLAYQLELRHTADVVVPRWGKYPEPLHAVYSQACLPPIEANLRAQRLKITGFFGQVAVRFVEREEIEAVDRNGRSFANVNTPEDLHNAKLDE
ncbi:MAG: molybdenum cofactor guanylyltransferase [Chloroflexi bacterium]|nr:molybdenum cofactor guanylyltransferase [Chloroflexota bacterium]